MASHQLTICLLQINSACIFTFTLLSILGSVIFQECNFSHSLPFKKCMSEPCAFKKYISVWEDINQCQKVVYFCFILL